MKKWYVVILAIVVALSLLPAFAHAQSNASIKIVQPVDRHNLGIGEADMVVEIGGVNSSDGYSWQPFLDGVPQGMVKDSLKTKLTVDNLTGPRRIKAVLYNASGAEIASNEILVIAAPIDDYSTDVFNRPWFVPFMAVFTLAIIGIIFLGLRLRPRPAA